MLRRIACALLVTLFAASCATTDGQPVNMLSTQDEVRLGKEMSVEIERQEKVLKDPAIQTYVRGIGERLVRVAQRQGLPYTFTVIDAPDTVNAFALPGGYMYIYTGLMKLCSNEAELAGVMAHELGHVVAQHHGRAMTRQMGYNLLMTAVLGQNPNAVGQLVGGFVGTSMAMRYSRQDEYEADRLGMDMLFRSGYRPDAMVSFMEKLQSIEAKRGAGPGLPLFSSHPPTQERAQTLLQLLGQYPQTLRDANELYTVRYQETVGKRIGQRQ